MATVSQELLLGRNAKAHHVAILANNKPAALGETLWLMTTTLPYTSVATKVVAANQADRQVLEDRIMVGANGPQTIPTA